VPLAELGTDPSVSRWFPTSEGELREALEPPANEGYFAIERDGEVIGMIQFWEETAAERRRAISSRLTARGRTGC
jgi:hypothetical protein